MGEYMALSEAAVTEGGNELDSVATATTVRVRNDETLVTDGPFVESKEALGGYYVFECDSIDEALHVGGEDPGREARRDRGPAGLRRRRVRRHEVRSAPDQQRRRHRRAGRR